MSRRCRLGHRLRPRSASERGCGGGLKRRPISASGVLARRVLARDGLVNASASAWAGQGPG